MTRSPLSTGVGDGGMRGTALSARGVRMRLARDELHVWLLPLDREPAEEALDALSRDERWRAGRFRFPRDRRRYVAAHLALRRTLASYVGVDPGTLRFERGEWGKPRLAGGNGPQFSLSHSGDLAIVAITGSLTVGADLERLRPMPGCVDLARAYFAPAELEALTGVDEPARENAFWRLWTRKEALVKGAGLGLQLPLDTFEVPLEPDDAEVVLPGSGAWGVRTVALPTGHVASVATPGRPPAWQVHEG